MIDLGCPLLLGSSDRRLRRHAATVEDRIQIAILTTIDFFITPRIDVAVKSINTSSGRDASSVTTKSERGEIVSITASFQKVSEKNNTFFGSNANDETQETSRRGT